MCPSYDRDQLVLLLQQLIQIPSIAPPGDEAPCADLLAQYLGDCPNLELSFQEIGENRKNLIATLKGTGEKKAILLNGHLDVVPVGERANWKYDPFGAQIVDGTMYGRGTGDMKAGLLALDMAVQGHVFQPGEGLAMADAEQTVAAIGQVTHSGMQQADLEILQLMLAPSSDGGRNPMACQER